MDDAMHIVGEDVTRTLCDQQAAGLNTVLAPMAPDHDEGGAWCWMCLAENAFSSPTERSGDA